VVRRNNPGTKPGETAPPAGFRRVRPGGVGESDAWPDQARDARARLGEQRKHPATVALEHALAVRQSDEHDLTAAHDAALIG
jgi:hypothetical protein